MPAARQREDVPEEHRIRPSDLVAEGGVAGNAEDLINAVYSSDPPELRKALVLRHHSRVHADDDVETPELDLERVASRVGLEHVKTAEIRGEDLNKAWIVYVAEDHQGANYKGALRYEDLDGKGVAGSHVSQAEAFEDTPSGQRLLAARRAREDEDRSPVRTSRRVRRPEGEDASGEGE